MIVSGGYKEIPLPEGLSRARELSRAWMHPDIPSRQWTAIESERRAVERGDLSLPLFRALVSLMRSAGLGPETAALTVLEVGASSGWNAEVIRMAGLKCAYDACDYSEAFKNFAARILPQIPYTVAEATQLPFADGSRDVVLLGALLLQVLDWPKALQEAARVASHAVVASKNPVWTDASEPSRLYEKLAYDVPCIEWRFREAELVEVAAAEHLVPVRREIISEAEGIAHISVLFAKEHGP